MSRDKLLSILAERILSLELGHPIRVGIDGRSAAGKSTFAGALARCVELAERQTLLATIDDFHPSGYRHRAAAGLFGDPAEYLREGYDFAAFRGLVLEPAGDGGSRRCRLRLWNARDDRPFPEEWVDVSDDAIVVVEAAFAFLPVFDDAWDFTIWLDIDEPTLFSRVVARDVEWVGSPDAVRDKYERSWLPRHELYERQTHPRERADVVVDNRDPEHPILLRSGEATLS